MKRNSRIATCSVPIALCLTVLASAYGGQCNQGALAPENANEARLNRIQPPEKVLGAIGLRAGMVVGEIGAGRGRYTVQIAARVGESGRVYANDIDAKSLRHLEQRCAKWGIGNVETVLGEETVPHFPEGELDLIFMISTYHHISQPIELMHNALPALKPEGKLAIAEWVKLGESKKTASATPPEIMERQMGDAGYELERIVPFRRTNDNFNLYIFRTAGGTD
jgi:precorrin-6B methylase 2